MPWRDRFCRSTGEPTATERFEPDLHRVGDKGVTGPKPTHRKVAPYTADAMSRHVQVNRRAEGMGVRAGSVARNPHSCRRFRRDDIFTSRLIPRCLCASVCRVHAINLADSEDRNSSRPEQPPPSATSRSLTRDSEYADRPCRAASRAEWPTPHRTRGRHESTTTRAHPS